MDKNKTRDPQLGQGEAELNLSLWGREEKLVGLLNVSVWERAGPQRERLEMR